MISHFIKKLLVILLFVPGLIIAQDLDLSLGADVVSRYIWRGTDVNDAVNIQPTISLSVAGFGFGFWGSYSLYTGSTNYEYDQEIDSWISYDYIFKNGINIGVIFTDYYYPGLGIQWGNFNNYNNPDGPGAHTIEAGLSLKLTETIPLKFSGYVNIYNDAGNNTYFQIDYSVSVAKIPIDFFIGAAGGSKANPDYYGTADFNVINIGVKGTKSIKITEDYSLPVFVSFIINPRTEIAYLVFGLTF